MMSEENIRAILKEVQAMKAFPHLMFNASQLSILSEYAEIAFLNNAYFDNEVMLGLLRLLSIYPNFYDKLLVNKILICALYNINTIDINTYFCLINANLFDQNLEGIAFLYDLILKCEFKRVWKCIYKNTSEDSSINNNGNEPEECPFDFSLLVNNENFTVNFRKYIMDSIIHSFETLTLKDMSEYLNIPDKTELENYISPYKWTIKKINHKGEDQLVCYNGIIENEANKKDIEAYFNDENIYSCIRALNY